MFSLRSAIASKVLILALGLLTKLDIFRYILTVIASTYSTNFRINEDNSQ